MGRKDLTLEYIELQPNVYLINKRSGYSCNVFLLKGENKNILIDVGVPENYEPLKDVLEQLGIGCENIHLVLLTHEHIDHIGCASKFPQSTIIAAHSHAANKISLRDEFVIMSKGFNTKLKPLHIDLHLDHGSVIDIGGMVLRAIYTPGHCSGSMCFYERNNKILFTGDTLFAGGTIGGIFASGNVSDYVASLELLREFNISHIYPGHGRMSFLPEEDFDRAIQGSLKLLQNTKSLFESINVSGSFDQLLKGTSVYSRAAAERRYFERIACDYSAVLYDSAGNHSCRVVEISEGGAKLDRVLDLASKDNVSIKIDQVGSFEGRIVSHDNMATRLQLLNTLALYDEHHETSDDKTT